MSIDLYKTIESILKCILFEQTKITFVSPNKNQIAYNRLIKYMPKEVIKQSDIEKYKIELINGSVINCVVPQEPSNVVRGKRSQLPMYYDLVDRCNISQEDLDEILEPYMNKKG